MFLNGEVMTHEVFISYSSKNAEYANAVSERLKSEGIECWIDTNNIRTATNFAQEIIDGLNEAKVVVLIYSKDSDQSKYVYREIETAFDSNKHIVPLKIDDTFPEELEFFLRGTQWLDASPAARENKNVTLDECYDEVVETVKKLKDVPIVPRKIVNEKVNNNSNKGFFEKNGKYIIVAAILLVVVGGYFAFTGMGTDSSGKDTNQTLIDIGYIGMQNNGGGSYSYYVYGEISNSSNISSQDVIHIDFYDKNGKVVDSSNSTVGKVNGNILGSVDLSSNNIAKVALELKDSNKKVLYAQESDNILQE